MIVQFVGVGTLVAHDNGIQGWVKANIPCNIILVVVRRGS